MKHITFRLRSDIARKLKREPLKNRRWNNQSEILRKLAEFYLENQSVRHAVHKALGMQYSELAAETIL